MISKLTILRQLYCIFWMVEPQEEVEKTDLFCLYLEGNWRTACSQMSFCWGQTCSTANLVARFITKTNLQSTECRVMQLWLEEERSGKKKCTNARYGVTEHSSYDTAQARPGIHPILARKKDLLYYSTNTRKKFESLYENCKENFPYSDVNLTFPKSEVCRWYINILVLRSRPV
jgi:hypothetical protein